MPPELTEDFEFHENGDTDLDYDMIVVYEGLSRPTTVKCPPGNLVYIAGEPPVSRVYTNSFLKQFNFVISSHTSIKHSGSILYQQSLPWHFGFDFETRQYRYRYEDLKKITAFPKSRKISIIASSKTMMPGHAKRKKFLDELKAKFGNSIDFYGKGINPVNDKADAIAPYYMSICIENSAIDNYWTEKIADAYLGLSLPVYYGCANIDRYFPAESYIRLDINNHKKAFEQIEYLLVNCEKIYAERITYIENARALLMEKYNIYPSLAKFIKENNLLKGEYQVHSLLPNHQFGEYKTRMYKLRIKRYLQKWFS
ncbi:MAG TPA: glycosyltransferase family 10 [Chitinophagaceae bacterium]|nr:glycosyltransferase family 10 [Chitinophagaceae bacterium]